MEADADLITDAIATTGALARQDPGEGLPHPATTDQLLRQHLGEATNSSIAREGEHADTTGWRAALKAAAAPFTDQQRRLNHLFVQTLHQLDHRSTRNQRELFGLRSTVDELTRRVEELERER